MKVNPIFYSKLIPEYLIKGKCGFWKSDNGIVVRYFLKSLCYGEHSRMTADDVHKCNMESDEGLQWHVDGASDMG